MSNYQKRTENDIQDELILTTKKVANSTRGTTLTEQGADKSTLAFNYSVKVIKYFQWIKSLKPKLI
jgi:hypothetical protein